MAKGNGGWDALGGEGEKVQVLEPRIGGDWTPMPSGQLIWGSQNTHYCSEKYGGCGTQPGRTTCRTSMSAKLHFSTKRKFFWKALP